MQIAAMPTSVAPARHRYRDVAAAPAWRASLATSKERFRQLTHALETSEPGLVSGD